MSHAGCTCSQESIWAPIWCPADSICFGADPYSCKLLCTNTVGLSLVVLPQGAHDMSTGLGSAAATSPAEPPSAAGPAATPAAAGPAGSSVGAGAATAERIAALVGTEDDAKRLWNISSNDIGMTDMKLDPAGRQKGWAVQTARMKCRQRPDLLNLLELVQLCSADPKKLKVSRSVDTRTGLVTVTAMVPEADRQKLEKLACCWMVALMCHGVPPSMRPPSSDAWPALDGLP